MADRQPAGVDASETQALASTHGARPGSFTLRVFGGQQCVTQSSTAWMYLPSTGASWEAEVVDGRAVFSFAAADDHRPVVGDRVILGWEPNRFSNVAEQRSGNQQALFAPFNVAQSKLAEPIAGATNCAPLIYSAVAGNNFFLKTDESLNAILANTNSSAWVTLTAADQVSQPITLGSGHTGARLRLSVQGPTFSSFAYAIQPATGPLAEGPCDPRAYANQPTSREWYCKLRRALLVAESAPISGQSGQSYDFVINPGRFMVEVKDRARRLNYIKGGRAQTGETIEDVLLGVREVWFSYNMEGGTTLPFARSGWQVDLNGSRTREIQVYWSQVGAGTATIDIIENPGTRNASTTTYAVSCGPGGCALQGRGRATVAGHWNAASQTASGVLVHPGGNTTTTACANIRIGNDRAVATDTRYTNPNLCGVGAFMNVVDGQGGTTFGLIR